MTNNAQEQKNAARQFEILINYVRAALYNFAHETDDMQRSVIRDELLELADFHGGQVAAEIHAAGITTPRCVVCTETISLVNGAWRHDNTLVEFGIEGLDEQGNMLMESVYGHEARVS